jgi:hypothetical protein
MSTSKFHPPHSELSILWRQVWGIAALLAAILFCFNAYGLYQPQILADLGFTHLAASLGILQGLLGAILEPLVGVFSDRILRRFGSRLPQISIGVTLAGLIFVVLGLLLEGNLPWGLRWLIPGLMIVWVMAMIVFRGPVIALLRQFAPDEKLPIANAVIILVLGLVGALTPLQQVVLKSLGATPTFILGAIALLLGAFCLYSQTPQHRLTLVTATRDRPASLQRLGLIFGVGLGAGLELNVLLGLFPGQLQAQLPNLGTEWIAAALLLVCALSANPWGELTVKLGATRAMQVGLAAMIPLMGLVLIPHSTIFTVISILALGLALGLVFISTIPFALASVPPSQAGLGTGLYFGGSGAGMAIFAALMQQGEIAPVVGLGLAAIAFFLAWNCLARLD